MDDEPFSDAKRQEIFESCLCHVEDFEDGPVSLHDLPAEAAERLWWTRAQKAAFVELVGRKGAWQLSKIGHIIGKSVAECETYLTILQAAAESEPGLPPLTYADIPAAIDDDDPETGPASPTQAFTRVSSNKLDLIKFGALEKKFNCVIPTEVAVEIEQAVVQRLKSILFFAQFSTSHIPQVEYMLDQFYEVASLADPDAAHEDSEATNNGVDLDFQNGTCVDDESYSDSQWSETEQLELENAETELLEDLDQGRPAQNSACPAELRAYMNLCRRV